MYLGRTIEGINLRGTGHSTAAVTPQAAVRTAVVSILGGKAAGLLHNSSVVFVDMGKRCCKAKPEEKKDRHPLAAQNAPRHDKRHLGAPIGSAEAHITIRWHIGAMGEKAAWLRLTILFNTHWACTYSRSATWGSVSRGTR
jgi:hypothetical protein